MAKFITFNGITYIHPGAVSKVDVSALAQVSLSATGIVGLIGEAEGGQPNMVTDSGDINEGVPKVYTFFDPANARSVFRSGPLADAVNLAFDAANDPRIAGGASQVLAIKTNQSTASDATLETFYTTPNDACTARTKDYGAHTGNVQIELDVSAADVNNNEVTVTVKDNSTGVTETHNNVAGGSLIDVQYRGPDTGNVIFTGTITGGAANTLIDTSATWNPGAGGSSDAYAGNWVRISTVPNVAAGGLLTDSVFVGQCRRISAIDYGTDTITLESPWMSQANEVAPLGTALPAGTTYEIVKECIGPFLAIDVASGASTVVDVAGGEDTATFDARFNAGTANFYFTDNGAGAVGGAFVSTGIFKYGTSVTATDGERYGLAADGPNYIKIVSGPGSGQIRQINVSTVATANNTLNFTIDSVGGDGWGPFPTAASQFVFVNLSKGTAGVTGNGALMSTTGTTGATTLLTLNVRPGYGGWNEAGAAVVLAGAANAAAQVDFTIPILADTTAAEVINLINSPAAPAISLSKQGWFARMGSGRVSTEVAANLDWDGVVNTSVFACLGFDQIYSNTWGITASSAPVAIVKKARLMDNLTQLINTVNAQSALVSLTKLTSAVTDGQGMPELNTPATPLTGGTAGTTATTDLANAYDVLIRHRCNTAVPLWSADDTAISLAEVHAATLSYTNLASGAAMNEADAILSATVSGSNALIELQNFQADLNNRNCALVYQGVQRLNVDSAMTQFPAHMLAVILAGMQAGTTVGEPLTYKYLRSNDLTFPPELDPKDVTVSNQLLLSGILFAEAVKGKGFRVVRNMSTYTQTDNLAYTERNVNEVLNYVSYDLRTFIEDRFTGLKATPATATSIKDSVISKLSAYRDADIIVDSSDLVTGQRINAFRNVRVAISGDIATVRFEMFPVIGINYETIEIFAQLPTISA